MSQSAWLQTNLSNNFVYDRFLHYPSKEFGPNDFPIYGNVKTFFMQDLLVALFCGPFREKGRDRTQSIDKSPYTHIKITKKQRDNIKNATQNFDYTTIADRLRTVSLSNSSHPLVWLIRFMSAQPSN